VLANDSDPDGDPLTVAGVGTPGHGTATLAGGVVTYTPQPGFEGVDHLLYTVSDGSGTARAAVSVYVGDAPLPPPPVLTLTPSFLDFGEVAIEKTRDLVLTVTNNTAAPVELAGNMLVAHALRRLRLPDP
jgi:Big-like domain-containing protein